MASEKSHDLIEIFKLPQNLNDDIPCNILGWRDAKYQPRGYLRKIAESSGIAEESLAEAAE